MPHVRQGLGMDGARGSPANVGSHRSTPGVWATVPPPARRAQCAALAPQRACISARPGPSACVRCVVSLGHQRACAHSTMRTLWPWGCPCSAGPRSHAGSRCMPPTCTHAMPSTVRRNESQQQLPPSPTEALPPRPPPAPMPPSPTTTIGSRALQLGMLVPRAVCRRAGGRTAIIQGWSLRHDAPCPHTGQPALYTSLFARLHLKASNDPLPPSWVPRSCRGRHVCTPRTCAAPPPPRTPS